MGKSDDKIERADALLDRLLQWIGRYDARSSLAVGFCLAMLGVLATTAPPLARWTDTFTALLVLTLVLIVAAVLSLYMGQYPRMEAPNRSLVYFGTIADLKADEFRKHSVERTDEEHLGDLLEQCHINACILARKFFWLRWALRILLASAVPWAIAIYLAKRLGG